MSIVITLLLFLFMLSLCDHMNRLIFHKNNNNDNNDSRNNNINNNSKSGNNDSKIATIITSMGTSTQTINNISTVAIAGTTIVATIISMNGGGR